MSETMSAREAFQVAWQSGLRVNHRSDVERGTAEKSCLAVAIEQHRRDQAEFATLREMLREACDGWDRCESENYPGPTSRQQRIAELRKRGGLEET